MILQMKNVGLSLKRIENILETKDLSVFEALLNEQVDELDEKISRYTTSRKALTRQLNSCRFLRNPPRSTYFHRVHPQAPRNHLRYRRIRLPRRLR